MHFMEMPQLTDNKQQNSKLQRKDEWHFALSFYATKEAEIKFFDKLFEKKARQK